MDDLVKITERRASTIMDAIQVTGGFFSSLSIIALTLVTYF